MCVTKLLRLSVSWIGVLADEMKTRRLQGARALPCCSGWLRNAGKSSMMRAMTALKVVGEDKLFATLVPRFRALQPITQPRILVSEYRWFHQKTADLVSAFHSTLLKLRCFFVALCDFRR